MAQMVFERHEKKYLLDKAQLTALSRMLQAYMQADVYGLHTICSLYFDTENFDVARQAEAKPAYKEKLRLRSYGVPGQDSTVYLELKKKVEGVTYKRRMALPLREANAYIWLGAPPREGGQVFGEIDWAIHRQGLHPKMLICYDRVALASKEDSALRLTLDANIRWRAQDLDLALGDAGSLLAPGFYMMEIKTTDALPVWLSGILAAIGAYPVSFSKYGNACQQLYKKQEVLPFGATATAGITFPKEIVKHAG